jgi:hypothetical protein
MKRSVSLPAILVPFALWAAASPLAHANGWQALTHQPAANASTLYLLMDGRVLMNEYQSTNWWVLTPDVNGSYLNGKWTAVHDAHDDRLYYASGVLADGRVLVAGGEYSNSGGSETNRAEIYDPVTDTWKSIGPPSGWGNIGDVPSTVLADGRFFLGNNGDQRTAIYDPVAQAWSGAADIIHSASAEETWVLLPDGTVVTPKCFDHPTAELYDPSQDLWVDAGSLAVDIVDGLAEIGPGMTLMDGRAFIVGSLPHSAIYTPNSTPGVAGTWAAGPDTPRFAGRDMVMADAPAAMLPNGNVLCAMADYWTPPVRFYAFDGTSFTRRPDPGNNGGTPYDGRMLVLPTGEILYSNGTIYLFTSGGGPDPSWRPTISSVSTDLLPGTDYVLTGTQLNGLSTANSYGDECNVSTNYPLVRLTFPATGHIAYMRAHDPSTMGFATGTTPVSTHFQVPATVEKGPAKLEVVANGIASDPVDVVVRDPITIDFDALATGVVVTSQYADATFSAAAGFDNVTVALAAGSSQPNVIETEPVGGPPDGLHDTYVDFPCPVGSLSFSAIAVDNLGPVANVNVYESGVLSATVPVVGVGTPTVPVRVDLTSYNNVTRVELVGITDAGGMGWDDFVFCLGSSASWTNYGTGFSGTLGVPSLVAQNRPVLGALVTITLGNSLGTTTPALLILGLSRASILTNKGGTILVAPLQWIPLSVPPAGQSLAGSLPNDPQLCGTAVDFQGLELDAGAAAGFSFTAGLELHLGY